MFVRGDNITHSNHDVVAWGEWCSSLSPGGGVDRRCTDHVCTGARPYSEEGYQVGLLHTIEEVWRQAKPRQTDVLVLWGKIAAHMLLFRLCSRRVDKRRAGSKIWGDICILHFL